MAGEGGLKRCGVSLKRGEEGFYLVYKEGRFVSLSRPTGIVYFHLNEYGVRLGTAQDGRFPVFLHDELLGTVERDGIVDLLIEHGLPVGDHEPKREMQNQELAHPGSSGGSNTLFFRTRMDGAEFGYKLAEAVGETVKNVDATMEMRLGLAPAAVNDLDILNAAGIRLFNTVLNQREFGIIWTYALKELIVLSTNDKNINKINSGFAQHLAETYDDDEESELPRLAARIKTLIDEDKTFGQSGSLQDYDYNTTVPADQRVGISYSITRLLLEEALLLDDLEQTQRDLLVSGLVVEFETLYRSAGHLYKQLKIV